MIEGLHPIEDTAGPEPLRAGHLREGAAMPVLRVVRVATAPCLSAPWDAPPWSSADTAQLTHVRPEGSGHRPRTRVRLLWDDGALYGVFRVEDRWVRCVHTRLNDPVYRDSCVELFLEPVPGRGYLNFEWNAGGTLLASHVTDPTRTPEGLRAAAPLTEVEASAIRVRTSLPRVVDPEVSSPLTWTLAFALPFEVLGARVGGVRPRAGDVWRGNVFKCADDSSHPHWISWAPLTARNFHLPGCFGALRFE